MERKIGETFEFEGKKLIVNEIRSGCKDCFFEGKCRVELTEIVGICGARDRTDKKDVVFVEVQEQSQEQAEQPHEEDEQPQDEQPQKLNL